MPKKTSLKNDYERMVPEFHEGTLMYGEHITRYESVVTLVRDKVVLDIASGSGYGSATLAQAAKKVYGVDVNAQAIAYAKERYGKANIEFMVGTGTNIPLADNSVDVVVSHETIEHIKDYKKFLQEIRRVLKTNGLTIMSTPNDDEYPSGNHFHLHQFKIDEFRSLLKAHFSNVKLYYQGAWITAALLDKTDFTSNWQKEIRVFKTHSQGVHKATYVVAVCSDAELADPELLVALTDPWSDKDQRILAEQRADELRSLKSELAAAEESLATHTLALQALEDDISELKNSHSWRITKPLRSLGLRLRRR